MLQGHKAEPCELGFPEIDLKKYKDEKRVFQGTLLIKQANMLKCDGGTDTQTDVIQSIY